MACFGQVGRRGVLVLAVLAAGMVVPAHATLQQGAPHVSFAGTVEGISPDTVAVGTANGTVLVPVSEASFAVNGMPFSAPSLTAGSLVTVEVPRSLEPVLTFGGLQLETDPAQSSPLAVASFDQFLAMPFPSDAAFLTPAPLLPDREDIALATHRYLLPPVVTLPPGVAPPAVPPIRNAFAMLPVAPAGRQAAPGPVPGAPAPYPPDPLANGSSGFNQAAFPDALYAPPAAEIPPSMDPAGDPAYGAVLGPQYAGDGYPAPVPFAYGYPYFPPYGGWYPWTAGAVGFNFGGLSIGFSTPLGGGGWNPYNVGWVPASRWCAWSAGLTIVNNFGAFGGPVADRNFGGFIGPAGFGTPFGVAPHLSGTPVTAVSPFTAFSSAHGGLGAPTHFSRSNTQALRSIGFRVPAIGGVTRATPLATRRYRAAALPRMTTSHYAWSGRTRFASTPYRAVGSGHYSRFSAPPRLAPRGVARARYSSHFTGLPRAATYLPQSRNLYTPSSYRSSLSTGLSNRYRPYQSPTTRFQSHGLYGRSFSAATVQPSRFSGPRPFSEPRFGGQQRFSPPRFSGRQPDGGGASPSRFHMPSAGPSRHR